MANNLKAVRLARDQSQSELAKKAGVSLRTLQHY